MVGVDADEGLAQVMGKIAVMEEGYVARLAAAMDERFIAQKVRALLKCRKEFIKPFKPRINEDGSLLRRVKI